METGLVGAIDEASETEEQDRFLIINKAALKRPGVILRLLSIVVCFVGSILAVFLPMVTIEYASYSSSTTFTDARAVRFPAELISGWNNLFGGDYFGYYLKSKYGAEVLCTVKANFNWVLFLFLIIAILFAVLAFLVTFSKRMEKLSKLVILGYILCGIACVCSPIWFMAVNNFGNTQAIATTDLGHYYLFDSLYVHDAFGAVVSCLVLIGAGIVFAVGTAKENAGGDNRNAEQ